MTLSNEKDVRNRTEEFLKKIWK